MLNPEIAYLPEDELADAPPRRRSKRGRRVTKVAVGLGMAALVGLGAVGGAYAAGSFTDVPADYTFKGAIDWATLHNVATGYPDNTFRPNNPVTRGQMTAFLRNYNFETSRHTETLIPAVPASSFNLTAECPSGKVPIAGGGSVTSVDTFITDSFPEGNGWKVRWETEGGASKQPSLTVYVTCKPSNAAS